MAKGDAKKGKADTDDGFVKVAKILDIAIAHIPSKDGMALLVNKIKRTSYGNQDKNKKQYKKVKVSLKAISFDTKIKIETCGKSLRKLINWGVLLSNMPEEPSDKELYDFAINTQVSSWMMPEFNYDKVVEEYEEEKKRYFDADYISREVNPTAGERRMAAVKAIITDNKLGLHPKIQRVLEAQGRMLDNIDDMGAMRQPLFDYVMWSNEAMQHLGRQMPRILVPARTPDAAREYRNWLVRLVDPNPESYEAKTQTTAFEKAIALRVGVSATDLCIEYYKALCYDLTFLQRIHKIPNKLFLEAPDAPDGTDLFIEWFGESFAKLGCSSKVLRDAGAHLAKVFAGPHEPVPVGVPDVDLIKNEGMLSRPLMQLPMSDSRYRSHVVKLRFDPTHHKEQDAHSAFEHDCSKFSWSGAELAERTKEYGGYDCNETLRLELKRILTTGQYKISSQPQVLYGLFPGASIVQLPKTCKSCDFSRRELECLTTDLKVGSRIFSTDADFQALKKESFSSIKSSILSDVESSTPWTHVWLCYHRQTQGILSETLWSGIESLVGNMTWVPENCRATTPFGRGKLLEPLRDTPTVKRPDPAPAPVEPVPEIKPTPKEPWTPPLRGPSMREFMALEAKQTKVPRTDEDLSVGNPYKLNFKIDIITDKQMEEYERERKESLKELNLPPPNDPPGIQKHLFKENPDSIFVKDLLAKMAANAELVRNCTDPLPPPEDLPVVPKTGFDYGYVQEDQDGYFKGPPRSRADLMLAIQAQAVKAFPKSARGPLNAEESHPSLRGVVNFNPLIVTGIFHDQEDYGMKKDEDLHAGMVRIMVDTFPEPPRSDTIQAFFDQDVIDKFIMYYGHLSFYTANAKNKIYDNWLEGWRRHLQCVNKLFDSHRPSDIKRKYEELYFTPDLKLRNEKGSLDTYCRLLYSVFEKKSKIDLNGSPFAHLDLSTDFSLEKMRNELDNKAQESYSIKDLLLHEVGCNMTARAEGKLRKDSKGKVDTTGIDKKYLTKTAHLQFLLDVVSGDYIEVMPDATRLSLFKRVISGNMRPSHFEALVEFYGILKIDNPHTLPPEYQLDKLPLLSNEMAVREATKSLKAKHLKD